MKDFFSNKVDISNQYSRNCRSRTKSPNRETSRTRSLETYNRNTKFDTVCYVTNPYNEPSEVSQLSKASSVQSIMDEDIDYSNQAIQPTYYDSCHISNEEKRYSDLPDVVQSCYMSSNSENETQEG